MIITVYVYYDFAAYDLIKYLHKLNEIRHKIATESSVFSGSLLSVIIR